MVYTFKRSTSCKQSACSAEMKWSEVKSLIRVQLFANPWTVDCKAPPSWDFPGKNTGVGCHFLLQGIFPTQGSNPGRPHCKQTLPSEPQGKPQKTWVQFPGQGDTLESEMTTHSSRLDWTISCTEEPGRLQSMGLQRVSHNWVTNTTMVYTSHE